MCATASGGQPYNWIQHAVTLIATEEGRLYFACDLDPRVLEITRDGDVRTVAGRSRQKGYEDGPGPRATFGGIHDMTMDQQGVLYLADTGNRLIRTVRPGVRSATVGTLAGSPPEPGERRRPEPRDGVGSEARLRSPFNLAALPGGGAVDSRGLVYAGYATWQVPPTGDAVEHFLQTGGRMTFGARDRLFFTAAREPILVERAPDGPRAASGPRMRRQARFATHGVAQTHDADVPHRLGSRVAHNARIPLHDRIDGD